VTLQFHSDDDNDDDDNSNDDVDDDDDGDDMQLLMRSERQLQQPIQRGRTYKGFWLRFEGSIFCLFLNQINYIAHL